MDSVHTWLSSNFLSLNPSKTVLLLVGTAQQRAKVASSLVSFADCSIPFSSSARNLGVLFDPDLSLSKHISSVCSRSFHYIRLLRQVRPSLDLKSATLVANSLVFSHLDYCNSLLYNLPETSLHRLQLVQNALARAVLPAVKRHHHISPALRSLHWLPVSQRIDYKLCVLTYKSLHNLAPPYLAELLVPYIPPRSLRSSNSCRLTVPLLKSASGRRSFSYAAPTLWNSLPLPIRLAPSLSTFCSALKTFLFPSLPP